MSCHRAQSSLSSLSHRGNQTFNSFAQQIRRLLPQGLQHAVTLGHRRLYFHQYATARLCRLGGSIGDHLHS